jgi:hypothetical protein
MSISTIKEYNGPQVVLTSNRLVFSTKNNEHIIFNSAGLIHHTSKLGMFLETGTGGSFVVNSPYVQLGISTKGKTVEPVVKGDKFEEIFNDLTDAVTIYSKMMIAAVAFPPFAVAASTYLQLKQANIKVELKTPGNVKSDVVSII